MTQELTVLDLILNASLFVQCIMGVLVLASVVSWFIIIQRWYYFGAAERALRLFERQFWSGNDLGDLYREGTLKSEKGYRAIGMEGIFRAGYKEFIRLRKQDSDPEVVMDGSERAMRVAMSREDDSLEKNLPFLATVGSTSPYVGLLGTVWGIMGSFQGLATMHQATLAVVAPGISEALVATAMGLVAAIPAVVAYNRFSAKADSLENKYQTFAEEFSSLLYRQVHSS